MAGWPRTSDGLPLHCYLVGVGSNMRHGRYGAPDRVVREAIGWLDDGDIHLGIAARRLRARPLGPSRREYANTVVLVFSALAPDALLARLKAIEAAFGRQRGRRWGARVLDLDIVLWSGGTWRSGARSAPARAAGGRWLGALVVPHPAFRARRFVLAPAAALMPGWRDPVTGLSLRQLAVRLDRQPRLA